MTDIRRSSAALASGTVVSRALGFVNVAVLAWVLGQTNAGANAFALANQLPNNVYAIIAGGLLTAILVPHIVRAAAHADGGQDFVNRLVTFGVVAFLGLTVIATVCAPLLVGLYTVGDNALSGGGVALAVGMAYWCLPQIFFYAVYSLIGEVLNARGVFGPFTWTPVLNNVVAIATMVLFAIWFGVDPAHRDPPGWDSTQVALLAGGATLGVAVQAIALLFFWRRTGLSFRPDFRWRGAGLGAPARAAGWTFGMILVTQLAGIVQSNIALTADPEDPSLAVLRTTWLIFMLPHSIVAVSIATPYFTRMSMHARDGDVASVRSDLSASLRTVGLLVTGAAVAIAAAAPPFAAFFAGDDAGSIPGIAAVLLAYLVGLVPFSALFIVQRAFYALGDTRTPFFLQVVQAAIFVAGAFALLLAPSGWVAIGIALVTSVAGTVQALIAAAVLRRRIGGIDGRRVARRYIVYALAGIPAAGAGILALWLLGGLEAGGFAISGAVSELISIAIIGAVAGGVYLGVLALVRVPELRAIVTRPRR